MRGRQRAPRLRQPGEQRRGQPAEHRVGHVVGKRQAGKAYFRRKRRDHQRRRHADHPAAEAGQRVPGHELRFVPRQQRAVQRVGGHTQPQRTRQQRAPHADPVHRPAGRQAAEYQRQRRQAVAAERDRGRNAEAGLHQGGRQQHDDDDRRRQLPRGEDRQHHGRPMRGEHLFDRHLPGELPAFAHLDEDRRFFQPAPQPYRDKAEHAADQERHAPYPRLHLRGAVARIDPRGQQRADQDAGGQAGRQRGAGNAHAAARHVLGDEHPGTRHFATDRDALHDPHRQQQQRRQCTDLRMRGQQADQQRRHRHHENTEREHALATQAVAEMRHHDAAQRTRHVAGGEDAVHLQLRQPGCRAGREEQRAQRLREKHEHDEVVELQRAAQRRQAERVRIAAIEGPRDRLRCVGGGHAEVLNGATGVAREHGMPHGMRPAPWPPVGATSVATLHQACQGSWRS